MDNSTIKEGFLGQRMIVLPNEVIHRLSSKPITRSFYVTDMGYYPKANYHHRKRKKGVGEYIFIYCSEGEGWYDVDDEITPVFPNQYFIIPRNTKHSYGAHKSNPWSIYWMHFNGLLVNDLIERYRLKAKRTIAVPFESGRIALFDQIFKIYKSSYIEPQMEYASISALNFLSSFIYDDTNNLRTDNYENLVDSITEFLTDNIDKSYTSEDIALKFNYSSSYIFNLFKKKTGYSLIHFFNLKKIQKSCEYIKYTDLNIKEISYKVGFQDPLYFSRLFKKYMGVSPKSYRTQIEN
ncbi:AraC family transcriptional regulator [Arenibacter sp. ARW7G5Y1]|uniref:AraC family transcriptional regulator n=1 Tax=Arenibacter sp. ARW7G5Y1 TaxID=2135619 RepID=UPI000D76C502|nr:AraC family transcriptional regulator [Arenibacter sp. ARW7G5Y1]PXX21829.1 AraC family transcriptional regulator [Arenibacter sp. ARW7G5Y1]